MTTQSGNEAPRSSPDNSPSRDGIQEVLRREIAEGRYKVGEAFPAEADLQDRFGVGRHTVREALKVLSEQGYIDRRRKRGTVVLSAKPQLRYAQPLGSLANLIDFYTDTTFEVHEFGYLQLRDSNLCELLKLARNRRWLHIAGVRKHRKTLAPLCWTEHFLPHRYAVEPSTLDDIRLPLYELVARTHGFEIDHVEQEIGAGSVSAGIAAPLNAVAGTSALLLVRRYHRNPGLGVPSGGDNLTQATLNIFPAGRYWVRSRIQRSG